MKSIRSFVFLTVLAAGFFIGVNSAAAEVITHDGWTTIATDTVWHEGDIHVITGEYASLTVDYGVKLILEPGAIIKLDTNAAIDITGKLSAVGTAEKPVIITSIKDDKHGGDTNGDGDATAPAPGDWAAIMVPVSDNPSIQVDGEVEISYAVISYGGRMNDGEYFPLIVGQSARFSITNSELFNNMSVAVILPQAQNFSITHSNIYAPDYCQEVEPGTSVCGGMVMSQNPALLDVSGNYWGSPKGPSVMSSDGIAWGGAMLGGNFNYRPFAAEKLELFKKSEVAKLNPVILIPGIMGSAEVPLPSASPTDTTQYAWALDPILRTYDNLWQALKNVGYKDGESLFAFPYQWRQSNVISAQQLKQKIEAAKAACVPSTTMDCTKVDLVGHSMGGLVARQYIESSDYAGDVDQVIFLATPHLGAPKAYMMWEAGEFGRDKMDFITKKILELEAAEHLYFGKHALFNYIHDFSIESVRELLPIYQYLMDDSTGQVRMYPDGYPNNPFLEALNNQLSLAKLQQVRVANIVADDQGNDTPVGFRVVVSPDDRVWSHGMPENYYDDPTNNGIVYGTGDETVPAYSNHGFVGNEINLQSQHREIVTDAQKAVIKELTGTEPTEEVRNGLVKNLLMVRIFSPADFQIVSPSGQRIGKDFDTGSVINELGGYYSGFESETEWAVIPNPESGDYQVRLKGTGTGDYKVSVSGISDEAQSDAEFTGSISPDQDRTFDLAIDSAKPELVEEFTPQDTVPPAIIIVSPTTTTEYRRADMLAIDYNASDDFSGVSSTEAKLDGAPVATTTVELFDLPLGTHQLTVTAIDNSGIKSEQTVDFNVGTDWASMIRETEIAFVRGLIADAKTKRAVVDDLQKLRIESGLSSKAIEVLEKVRESILNNENLHDAVRAKLLAVNDKLLAKLKTECEEKLSKDTDKLLKSLGKYLKQGRIEQRFYDIMNEDVQFITNNS